MKPGGGRPKGNGFERLVASMVIEAFEKFDITKKDCYRTPGSGGHRQARNEDPGDLVISKKLRRLFPFSVECKFYKNVPLWYFWIPFKKHKKSWKVRSWLDQTISSTAIQNNNEDAEVKLEPLLVFKSNGNPIFCCAPEEHYPLLNTLKNIRFKHAGIWWRLVMFEHFLTMMVSCTTEVHKLTSEKQPVKKLKKKKKGKR